MAVTGKKLEEALRAVGALHISQPRKGEFDAPQPLKKAAEKDAKSELDGQRPRHRTALLWIVSALCGLSFLLLAGIVIFQMNVRLTDPAYVGVSDTVVNILTGGVFGELIAVIAVIAKEVWKDPS